MSDRNPISELQQLEVRKQASAHIAEDLSTVEYLHSKRMSAHIAEGLSTVEYLHSKRMSASTS